MAITQVARLMQDTTYQASVRCQNVLHFYTESTDPLDNVAQLAAEWNGAMVNAFTGTGSFGRGAWAANVHPAIAFNTLFWSSLYPDASQFGTTGLGGLTGIAPWSVSITGALLIVGSAVLPVVASGILTWRTGLAGRQNRGRTYIAGVPYGHAPPEAYGVSPGNSVIGGAFGGAPRANLLAIGNAIMANFGPSGSTPWRLCVISRVRSGTVPTGGSRPVLIPPIGLSGVSPVIDFTVPNYWGSMGSRRGGRGI